MNEHQAAANYILGKMRTVQLIGDESEAHSQAKLWLRQIIQGDLNVQIIGAAAADSGDRSSGQEAKKAPEAANGAGAKPTSRTEPIQQE